MGVLVHPLRSGSVGIDAEESGAAQARIPLEQQHPGPAAGCGERGGNAGGTAAHHDDLLFPEGACERGLRLVGELAEPGEPARHFQRDAAEQARPDQQMVVIEPLGKEEVGRAQEVGLGAERGVLPRTPHPFAQAHAARGQAGHAVHAHQALPARAGQAERSARPVELDRPGEGGDACAQERGGDGVPFPSLQAIAVERKAEH